MSQLIVFLAGIGQDASEWAPVADGLQGGWRGEAFAVSDLVKADEAFTMAGAVAGIHREINRLDAAEVVLCGLSLGAMMATSYAIAHPERVKGLVLAASQVRPKPMLMFAEAAAVSVLPSSWLGLPSGLPRKRLREIIDVAGRVDYRSSLPGITTPTLVVCGSKDKANLPAANLLTEKLPNATLTIIDDAGHALNQSHPVELGHAIADFLMKLG